MDSDKIITRPLKTLQEIDESILFLSKVFLEKDHMMTHTKVSHEEFISYYSSIKYAYVEEDFSYGAYYNGELKGSTISIRYNHPAIYEFKVPETLKKFDSFFDKAIEANSPFIDVDRCITLMCIGSDMKGVGKGLMSHFFEQFMKQRVFSEVYVEVSNPITLILIEKAIQGKKDWEIKKINEMVYDEEIKVDFILCRYLKNI